ncbi:MAG TPA: histidine ammonia-lyase [Thermoleophilaceae bacterium]|nr:histidine ammonia-lyase [Thermoleophilaceae bacterium]
MEIGEPLTLVRLEAVARGAAPPGLDGVARERIRAARAVVEEAVARGEAVYGVTTGIGDLAGVRIAPADAERLQLNLLRSHAVGAGEKLPDEVVRAMMLLLAASLARGHSGVRVELVELVLACLERGVVPVVPSRGSVGSSGDLAPLAHLGLVLVGEGEATFEGRRHSGAEALQAAGLEPLRLTAKEGLALINGTHLMAAVGALATTDARRVLNAATTACALSLEAFKGSTVPFDARLQRVRPQPGQARVAARLRELLEGSQVVASHADCGRVQDPYTLRCAPQVLGAVADALDYVRAAVERELAAVTDNPLVFPDDGDVVNGGNFHGQPLSLPLDHLALAVTELASYSERRTYALLSPSYAELPRFLSPTPGLGTGLMIAQYAAAALVNECQVLAHPAGAGSIPTSAGQEDFNSMGAWAALKARTVVEHAARVVATELVCACQGLEFHRPLRTTPALEDAVARVREIVPRVEEDRSLAEEIGHLADEIRTGELTL